MPPAVNIPKRHRAASAFSLAELLVALALAGTLLLLAFPLARTARSQWQKTGCVNNLRQLGTALTLYAADHNGAYPHNPTQRYWYAPLTLASALVVDSNTGAVRGYLPWNRAAGNRWADAMLCPADPNRTVWSGYPRSYVYRQSDTATEIGRPILLSDRKSGIHRWVVIDRCMTPGEGETPYPGIVIEHPASGLPKPDNWAISSYWHREGGNVLYEDGAVRWASHRDILGHQ